MQSVIVQIQPHHIVQGGSWIDFTELHRLLVPMVYSTMWAYHYSEQNWIKINQKQKPDHRFDQKLK